MDSEAHEATFCNGFNTSLQGSASIKQEAEGSLQPGLNLLTIDC